MSRNNNSIKIASKIITALLITFFITFSPAEAENSVGIDVTVLINDTISIYYPSSFDFSIANDVQLGGLSLGFKVFSPDGVTWAWIPECMAGMNPAFVCIVPGSRADGPMVWDVYPIYLEVDVDGASPDYFMFGGLASMGGLPPGPLEHMYSAHFQADVPGELGTICIDSSFIPPSGAFVFTDMEGSSFSPVTLWSSGGKCWMVGTPHGCYPDWDGGNPTSMVIVHCETGMVQLSATSMEMEDIYFRIGNVVGGGGTASVNGIGEVSYTPVPSDVGQAIEIVVETTCGTTPFGSAGTWVLSVEVTNDIPDFDGGVAYVSGATNNLITKNDITVIDNDACDELVYTITSGPGQFDQATGVYTWMPGPTEIGEFAVSYEVTDGIETFGDGFNIVVVDEACCPGDANYTGDVNVGDAVFLINYIFKGGPAPNVMNWADTNADCTVNVGDAVFLINFIFNSSMAPQLGCYY